MIAPGDVVVVALSADNADGLFGELLATSYRALGAKGLIIEAGCRDVRALQEMGFPVWARAVRHRCDGARASRRQLDAARRRGNDPARRRGRRRRCRRKTPTGCSASCSRRPTGRSGRQGTGHRSRLPRRRRTAGDEVPGVVARHFGQGHGEGDRRLGEHPRRVRRCADPSGRRRCGRRRRHRRHSARRCVEGGRRGRGPRAEGRCEPQAARRRGARPRHLRHARRAGHGFPRREPSRLRSARSTSPWFAAERSSTGGRRRRGRRRRRHRAACTRCSRATAAAAREQKEDATRSASRRNSSGSTFTTCATRLPRQACATSTARTRSEEKT